MVFIVWTSEAEGDLNEILSYISKSSFQYAKGLFNIIHEEIEDLKLFPKMGRNVPESNNPQVRELLVQKYRIIYRFMEEDGKILILMLIHGSRLLKI